MNKITPKFSTEEFVSKAKALFGTRYDYSLVIYTGSRNKVKLICKKGHKYQQQASKHLSGTGCPKCFKESRKVMAESWYQKN